MDELSHTGTPYSRGGVPAGHKGDIGYESMSTCVGLLLLLLLPLRDCCGCWLLSRGQTGGAESVRANAAYWDNGVAE